MKKLSEVDLAKSVIAYLKERGWDSLDSGNGY